MKKYAQMDEEHIVIDDTWYHRTPGADLRISAGGIVLRRENYRIYLALAREADFPLFVLPKGGVEPGETLEAAARREILEEVGLSELQLLGKIGMLERLSYNKRWWLQTHFFLYVTSQTDGVPTDTDSHYAVWWFPIDELPPMLWPDQRQLIEAHRHRFNTVFLDSDHRGIQQSIYVLFDN